MKRKALDKKRNLEYVNENELVSMTGISREHWDRVVLQELIDNSLDHGEVDTDHPKLEINQTQKDSHKLIEVTDWGAGLDEELIHKILDFDVRASTKRDYMSITRGSQGNALKSVIGMSTCLRNGLDLPIKIVSRGKGYEFLLQVDKRLQKIDINEDNFTVENDNITSFEIPLLGDWSDRDYVIDDYRLFNPHAEINGVPPTTEIDKQTIDDSPSIHHYKPKDFESLLNGEVRYAHQHGQKPDTLRQFISQFRGFKGNTKQITDQFEAKRIDQIEKLGKLNKLLLQHSTNPRPQTLGYVGENNFKTNLPEDVEFDGYKRIKGYTDEGIPYILEGLLGFDEVGINEIKTAINFRPTYEEPVSEPCIYETTQGGARGRSLESLLRHVHINELDKGYFFIFHLISPNLSFKEKGKMRLSLPYAIMEDIARLVWLLGKDYYKAYEKRLREAKRERREREKSREQSEDSISQKDATFELLPKAIKIVSSGGQHLFPTRRLWYKIRELIIKKHGEEPVPGYSYFRDTLMDQWEDEHGVLTKMVKEPRGSIYIPHQDSWAVDTVSVRDYEVPEEKFNKIMFVEKNGHGRILASENIPEKYSMPIIAERGYSTDSARDLIQKFCDTYKDITVICLHDCDVDGYKIWDTLNKATRFEDIDFDVVDLGLRLEDARELEFEPETSTFTKKPPGDLESIVDEETYDFVVSPDLPGKTRRRHELDVFESTEDFLDYVEDRLAEEGIDDKYCPDRNTLIVEGKDKVNETLKNKVIQHISEQINLDKIVNDTLAEVKAQAENPSNQAAKDIEDKLSSDPPLTDWDNLIEKKAVEKSNEAWINAVDKRLRRHLWKAIWEKLQDIRPKS